MSDLRKAAQQALEFVTSEAWGKTPYMDVCVYEDAARLRDALRAALAQEQATGSWHDGVLEGQLRERERWLAQQPEPVQEPVAWIQPDHLQKARVAPFLCRVEPTQRCADFVPFWTTPPQRPRLTDEEIAEAVREADLDWQAGWTLDEHEPNRFTTLARAIERKVRGEAE